MIFGPVLSRRLGRSLGINNIPPKNCTYSCIYCQLGRTKNIDTKRRDFYNPDGIIETEYEGNLFYNRKLTDPVNKNPLGTRME